MKRRIRVFPGMQLMETSCCGLPAYADAHKNKESLSLTKSISKYFGENEIIKYEEGKPMENQVEVEKSVETKEISTPAETKTVETEKTEKVETVKEDAIAKTMAIAVKEAMKEIEMERALVEKGKQTETKKSIGELALEMFRREHKN
jgi:hypothetical protein